MNEKFIIEQIRKSIDHCQRKFVKYGKNKKRFVRAYSYFYGMAVGHLWVLAMLTDRNKKPPTNGSRN